jgi:hypothetical protein
MSEITRLMLLIVRVGDDLAKNLIQVHAADAAGSRAIAKALKRDQFVARCEQLHRGHGGLLKRLPPGSPAWRPAPGMHDSSQPTS